METPDFSMTTLEAAMQNTAKAVSAQIVQMNESLKAAYLQQFNNWAQSVDIGRIDNSNPPKPPMAYIAATFQDQTNPNAYWTYPAQGITPVCDMPPIPASHPQQVHPAVPGANVMNVPPGDVLPIGFIVTSSDGTKWQKQQSPTPFGVATFYAKIG